MKYAIALMMVLAAGVSVQAAFAQVNEAAQARIQKVMDERDKKLKHYYLEDVKAAKGNTTKLNAVGAKYSPVFSKEVIGTDPALEAEQRVKLRKQNLTGRAEAVSQTESEISATTIKEWRDDVAREHAVDSFRNKDTKSMKMMFDARRQEINDSKPKSDWRPE